MYPAYVREKARQLRIERRLSIDEIAERLSLSRTTVYYWVRDLPLGRARFNNAHPGNRAMQLKYRRLREAAYAQGRGEFAGLAADPTFRDFVCLYIAEGYKRTRHNVSICNSDPAVVVLGARWIKKFSRNPVTFSVQYHADQRLERLFSFWSAQLGISRAEIHLQRKSNSNRLSGRTWRSENGVLTVRACDTQLRARVQAWMDCLKETWVLDSTSAGA
jgi:AcrR family transcriptional regulator